MIAKMKNNIYKPRNLTSIPTKIDHLFNPKPVKLQSVFKMEKSLNKKFVSAPLLQTVVTAASQFFKNPEQVKSLLRLFRHYNCLSY